VRRTAVSLYHQRLLPATRSIEVQNGFVARDDDPACGLAVIDSGQHEEVFQVPGHRSKVRMQADSQPIGIGTCRKRNMAGSYLKWGLIDSGGTGGTGGCLLVCSCLSRYCRCSSPFTKHSALAWYPGLINAKLISNHFFPSTSNSEILPHLSKTIFTNLWISHLHDTNNIVPFGEERHPIIQYAFLFVWQVFPVWTYVFRFCWC